MKKAGIILIILIVLIIVVIAGFFGFNYFTNSSPYKLTSSNVMNPVDFLTPGGIKQIADTYTDSENGVNFNVRVMQFSNEQDAVNGISKMEELYNPAMIGINGKYVKYKETSQGSHMFYYKSGKNIIFMEYSGDKTFGDNFIFWFYSKYPNE